MTTVRTRPVLLEVAVASPDDAMSAQEGGANRLELNSALCLGGLTPSLGTFLETRERTGLPIIVMIRPRAAGFAYSGSEFAVMRRDVDLFCNHGAAGVAFGILRENGAIDEERNRILVEQLGPTCHPVFHRAFDVTPEARVSLEILVRLGFRRVMTSGQEDSAFNGVETIGSLIRQSAGRIEILPAGGINRFTLADVLARTGCDQVHASLKMDRNDPSTAARPFVKFGGISRPSEERYDATDPAAVAELRGRLDRP